MKGRFVNGVPSRERYRESARSRRAAEKREGRALSVKQRELAAR